MRESASRIRFCRVVERISGIVLVGWDVGEPGIEWAVVVRVDPFDRGAPH